MKKTLASIVLAGVAALGISEKANSDIIGNARIDIQHVYDWFGFNEVEPGTPEFITSERYPNLQIGWYEPTRTFSNGIYEPANFGIPGDYAGIKLYKSDGIALGIIDFYNTSNISQGYSVELHYRVISPYRDEKLWETPSFPIEDKNKYYYIESGGSNPSANCWYEFRIVNTIAPGDANNDGKIDGGDLAYWQQNYDPIGNDTQNYFGAGDFNNDGKIDGGDLSIWQQNYNPVSQYSFGGIGEISVPEPATLLCVGSGLLGILGYGLRKKEK